MLCGLFRQFDNENIEQNRCWHVPFMLSERVLAQWWHPVTSSEALNHLYRAMHAVSYRCIAMAIETASKVGVLFDCCFVDCCPGGRWGDTEQVGARCRHPVAYRVARNMPHCAKPSVLLRRTAVAIKMAGRRGAFVRYRQFCHRR